jgi:excinuclease ABC subunit A
VRIDGKVVELSEEIELDKKHLHTILKLLLIRLIKKEGLQERLVDSLTTCLKHSDGVAIVEILDENNEDNPEVTKEIVFSEKFACPEHGAVMEELSPRLFSFNSPYGACPNCHGLGSLRKFSADLVIPDPKQPVYSAIAPWSDKDNSYYLSLLYGLGQALGFEIQTPWRKLTKTQQDIILYGSKEPIYFEDDYRYDTGRGYYREFAGVINILDRNYQETTSEVIKQRLEKYIVNQTCEVCHGKRLKPEALSVRLGQYTVTDFIGVPIRDCLQRINDCHLTPRQALIGELALKEIKARLQFLIDVGLDYLTLD